MSNPFNVEPESTVESIYNNDYSTTYLSSVEQNLGQQKYKNMKSNRHLIPPYENRNIFRKNMNGLTNQNNDRFIQSLSGVNVSKENFTHKNMVPFFGSKINQNLESDSRTKFETFTGSDNTVRLQKNSVEYMFPIRKEFRFQRPGVSIEQSDYVKPSMFHQGVRPHEEVHVPKGIGKGMTTDADVGFHYDSRDHVINHVPTIDSLRPLHKKRESYETPVNTGKLRNDAREMESIIPKNRPDLTHERNKDHYFVTVGNEKKMRKRPEIKLQYTNRKDTIQEYSGNPVQTTIGANSNTNTEYSDVKRQDMDSFGYRNVNSTNISNEKEDYGRSSVNNKETKKSTLTTSLESVANGFVSSFYKEIVAPLTDIVKYSNKEEFADHPRSKGGNVSSHVSKNRVYDPNDIARTTNKETTLFSQQTSGSIAGPIKNRVFDPNDVAKTTIKETTLHDTTTSGNMKDTAKHGFHYYDPNDVAKSTQKELLSTPLPSGNLNQSTMKTTVIDPNTFIARTTLKETGIDNTHIGFQDVVTPKNQVMLEDVAKTTVKETTLFTPSSHIQGLSSQRIFDKEALTPDTTTKDLTLERKHEGAAYLKQDMGYTIEVHDPKNTNRNIFSVKDYYGSGKDVDQQRGSYTVTKVEVSPTHRDFYADCEYNGTANAQSNKQPISRENYENYEFDGIKESLEKGREPTAEGMKIPSSTEHVNLSVIKRQSLELQNTNEVVNRVQGGNNYMVSCESVRHKPDPTEVENIKANSTDYSLRNDPQLMKAYHSNPYTIKFGNMP